MTREAETSGNVTTRSWLAATLLLAAALLAANVDLLRGVVGPKWDADDFFGPYFTLVADHARAGRVLLWDPWTSGGSPDFADPQIGAFSPLTVLVGAAAGGSEVGFRAYWLLLWFAGPAGLLVLARHLRAPAWGGAVVATGFAFSGFYTGHAEHTSLLYPIAFLPLLVWRLDVALVSRRLWPAVEAGALWGLSALGAYPLLAVLNGAFALLWALGRWCCDETRDDAGAAASGPSAPPISPTRLWFAVLAVSVLFVVGVLILLPPYYGLVTETDGYTDRAGVLPRGRAVASNALHPGALATLASPYLPMLQLPRANPGLWEGTDISTSSVYMGAGVTVLAGLALAGRPRSRWRWWLAGVAFFFLACALGDHLPLRGWLYDVLPPMRYFRHPGFFRVYAMFVAAVLGLLATRDLRAVERDASSPLWRRFAATAVAGSLLAFGLYARVLFGVGNVGSDLPRATLHLGLVWLGIVAVPGLVLLTGRPRLLAAALGCVVVLDAALTITLTAPIVYEAGPPRKVWNRLNASHNPVLDLTSNGLARSLRPPRWIGGHPNNKNLPLKVPTLENFVAFGNRFHRDLTHRPILADMATGDQRLWFAQDVAIVPPTDAGYVAFARRTEAIGTPVLVLHPRPEMSRIHAPGTADPREVVHAERISRLGPAERVTARLLVYEPGRLEFEVSSANAGSLLVTERWAPGWRATVNGIPAEVWGANFIFRAVPVQAGVNAVRFAYHPAGWPGLLATSWGTLLIVLAGSLARAWKTRPRSGRRVPAAGNG